MQIMQMQTGPAPGQRMRNWLTWTGVVELINIVIFSAAVWRWTGIDSNGQMLSIPGWTSSWPFTLLGLALLDLMLLEGGLYWLAKRRRLSRRRPTRTRPGLIRALYVANGLALASFPVAALFAVILVPRAVRAVDLLLGLALFAFACGEFVHYFLFKINMRQREWRAARARGRPGRARIWRELRRVEAAARRAA